MIICILIRCGRVASTKALRIWGVTEVIVEVLLMVALLYGCYHRYHNVVYRDSSGVVYQLDRGDFGADRRGGFGGDNS